MKLRRCPWCGQGFFRENRYLAHFQMEAAERRAQYLAARGSHRESVGIAPSAGRTTGVVVR
jgi:hypothetical protein